MEKRSLRDIPLQEITLRKYESGVGNSKEEIARRFLLSVGLIQPGESRDIIVPIFKLFWSNSDKSFLPSDVLDLLGDRRGASAPNVRRQIRRMRELKIIEKRKEGYHICDSFSSVVNNYIIPFVVTQSLERLKEYADLLDKN